MICVGKCLFFSSVSHDLAQSFTAKFHMTAPLDTDRLSTNSVLIGGAGPGAPMAPAVAVKRMSVDEKNRQIRARAVAEAKK